MGCIVEKSNYSEIRDVHEFFQIEWKWIVFKYMYLSTVLEYIFVDSIWIFLFQISSTTQVSCISTVYSILCVWQNVEYECFHNKTIRLNIMFKPVLLITEAMEPCFIKKN